MISFQERPASCIYKTADLVCFRAQREVGKYSKNTPSLHSTETKCTICYTCLRAPAGSSESRRRRERKRKEAILVLNKGSWDQLLLTASAFVDVCVQKCRGWFPSNAVGLSEPDCMDVNWIKWRRKKPHLGLDSGGQSVVGRWQRTPAATASHSPPGHNLSAWRSF